MCPGTSSSVGPLLLGYQYDLEFWRSEQYSNADAFSRLPRQSSERPDGLEAGTTAFNLHQIETVTLTAEMPLGGTPT